MPMIENFPAYWYTMGLSMLLCALLVWMLLRREKDVRRGKAAVFGLSFLVLGTALGLAAAKGAYLLIRITYANKQFLSFVPEEFSYYGGVAGVILAAVLSALIARIPVRKALNTFAPAGALLAAMARFAEAFLGFLGTAYLPDETVLPFPLAVTIDYSGDGSYVEYYLAVFVLEGLFSLIAMIISEIRRDEPDRFVRTLFYLCLPQIMLEYIRSSVLAWLFIKVEQLLCFMVVETVLVWYGIAAARKHRFGFIPAIVGLAVAGLEILAQFAIDGKIWEGLPGWICYAAMGFGVVVLIFMEHWGRSKMMRLRGAPSSSRGRKDPVPQS